MLILAISDFLVLSLTFNIAILIRIKVFPIFNSDMPFFNYSKLQYSWLFPIFMIVFLYEGLYNRRWSLWDEIKVEVKSVAISVIAIFSILFIMKKGNEFSRALVITHAILTMFIWPVIRRYAKRLIFASGLMLKKVLIVGSGESAKKIICALRNEKNLGYRIAGILDDSGLEKIDTYKVHRGIKNIEKYIKNAKITDVIIAKEGLSKEELAELINHIQHKAQNTLYIPEISGIAVSGTEIKYFFREQSIAIEIKNNLSNPVTYISKRVMDYFLAIIVFIVILPLMITLALIIKLTSEGPAVYSQNRIGKKGREFKCHKFRTMYKDADKKLKEILEKDPALKEEYQKYWKIKKDPRITKIGHFLRKTSLDELPQIFNVLKGEMSLVGPRPYLPKEWEFIEKESPIIHALPPGITGLWQVSGRNNQDYSYRITMDSWYVKNWNLWLDIMILFKTFSAVIKRDGAC
ncbi:MAG: undecaprenyl-phosphate galactose phosphotransferase WbaP [Elusimicrobiota bacterium]